MTAVCSAHIEPQHRQYRPAVAVCHHCGGTLCTLIDLDQPGLWSREQAPVLCGLLIEDHEFHTTPNFAEAPEKACHCTHCLTMFHSNYRFRLLQMRRLYPE